MMKHKWYKEIQAWSEGAEIEIYMHDKWTDIDTPQWHQDNEYRTKPQQKQPKYLYVYYRDKVYFLQDKDASNRYYIGKIEVQDD
jgi:TusA-related sulfurtransferase